MIHTPSESFEAHDTVASIFAEPDAASITIPDAHLLFTADFNRKGSDLVLTGDDGHKVLVADYFRHEKQPDLVSPEGALLSASLVELLAGSVAPGQYAQDPQAAAPAAQQPIGRVETVSGSATVTRNGVAVDLNVGDLVFQGDVVQTRSDSTLGIGFSDGSAFSLKENARMALNEFVYDPNSTSNSALINLVQGTVSFIASQVAKTGNMRVETPTATLGIRGTFVTVDVSSVDGHTVASLGLETNPTTGEQYAGAFTLTNRITGNQVNVNSVNSLFSVSPAGLISESAKPLAMQAIEQASFHALSAIAAATAAGMGTAPTGPKQFLNDPNSPSPTKAGDTGQSSGPASGGSSGANTAPTNTSPTDNHPTIQLTTTTPSDTHPDTTTGTTVVQTPPGPPTPLTVQTTSTNTPTVDTTHTTHTAPTPPTPPTPPTVQTTSTNTPTVDTTHTAPTPLPPAVTTPTISSNDHAGSSTVREGDVLTASAQSDKAVSYAWYHANDLNTAIGTGATYTVKEGDETSQIVVVATATNGSNETVTATSEATAAVKDALPTVTTPTISSNDAAGSSVVREGDVLTASASGRSDSDNSISYKWYYATDLTHANAIGTGATYTVSEADEGKTIVAVATATNGDNETVTATSAATAAVIDVTPTLTVPFSYAVDELTIVKNGTQIYDNTFTQAPPQSPDILKMGVPSPIEFISSGTWTESADGKAAVMSSSGAVPLLVNDGVSAILNTNTQSQSTSDLGLKLNAAFTVSAKFDLSNPAGTTGYGLGLTDGTSTHSSDEVVQIVVQKVNGNVVVDLFQADFTAENPFTLLASQTITSAQLAANDQIQFQLDHAANSTAITGSFELLSGGTITGTTTFLGTGQEGTIFTNGVTWTRAELFSFATPATVTISDTTSHSSTVREGDVLAANAASNDADATIHYQWQELISGTWTNIGGATASTYTVLDADEGHVLRVVATTSDLDNSSTPATATSTATATVKDALPTVTTPTISSNDTDGSSVVREGDVLTASASGRSDGDNSISYKWYYATDLTHANAIGTGATHAVSEADEGKTIVVVATSTNGNSETVTATSAATVAVIDETPSITVSISGTAAEGHTLHAVVSGFEDDDTLSYQWQSSLDGGHTWNNIADATSACYQVQEGDHQLQIVVTDTTEDHSGTATASAATYVGTQGDDWNTAASGSWGTATNWSNGAPTSSLDALINATGASYTVSLVSAAVANSLVINSSNATLAAGSDDSLAITGALTVDAGNISLSDSSTQAGHWTIQAASIDLESAATLVGFGKVSGAITNFGSVEAQSSHTLDISGNISGTGSLEVLNHATLEIDGSVAATQTLTFEGGSGATGTLVLDHSLTQSFSAVISGLGQSDDIDLKDLTFTSGHMTASTSYANGDTTLVVSNTSTNQSVSLTLSGDYTHSSWTLAQDSGTGTIFHDPPATDTGAATVAGSASTDLAHTVNAALNMQGATLDQFTFQSDSQSGSLAADPTPVASVDPSATEVVTPDTTSTPSDHQPTAPATTAADTGPASNIAATSQQPTGDTTNTGTQAGATTQTAVAPAAIGPNGSDTFVFAANFGHETITNFHPDTDVIEIDHTVFADFQALLAATHDDGHGNAVIAANPNDSITVKNVTVAQLVQHQSDFHFT